MDDSPKFQHLPKFDYLFPASTPEADALVAKVTDARQKFVRESAERRRRLIEWAAQEGIYIEACAPEFSPPDANGVIVATMRYRIIDTRGAGGAKETGQ